MNREIKFRGQIVTGEYVFGTYHFSADGKHHYILNREKFLERGIEEFALHSAEVNVVSGKSVAQYAGLKDKKGKELYEGDHFQFKAHKGVNVKDFEGSVVFEKESACWGYYSEFAQDTFQAFHEWDELEKDFLNHIEII